MKNKFRQKIEGKREKIFEEIFSQEEKKILDKLNSPAKIQKFLDNLKYNSKGKTNSPRGVLKNKTAHCFDGALFAAAALRNLGHEPSLINLKSFSNDDDHVLAVYRKNGLWGCIAKSNFTVLRSREPMYRTLREMVMSYFDFYFNAIGEKTLKAFSRPLNLKRFDRYNWMTTDGDVDFIGNHLDSIRHYKIMDSKTARKMSLVSSSILKAGLLGSDPEGLFKI